MKGVKGAFRSCAHARPFGDDGGVWILTGLLLGALVYIGMLVMAAAGFTVVVPLIVIPPVLVGIIGANNLLGGGRPRGGRTR